MLRFPSLGLQRVDEQRQTPQLEQLGIESVVVEDPWHRAGLGDCLFGIETADPSDDQRVRVSRRHVPAFDTGLNPVKKLGETSAAAGLHREIGCIGEDRLPQTPPERRSPVEDLSPLRRTVGDQVNWPEAEG